MTSLKFPDGTVLEGETLRKIVTSIGELEDPLLTLERRGIDLRVLAAKHQTERGLLPRYRVFLGRQQHWFADKAELDKFLAEQETKLGHELRVADDGLGSKLGMPRRSGRRSSDGGVSGARSKERTRIDSAGRRSPRNAGHQSGPARNWPVTGSRFATCCRPAAKTAFPFSPSRCSAARTMSSFRACATSCSKSASWANRG